MIPKARDNWLDVRTIGYSLAIASIVGWMFNWWIPGLVVGAVVYVIAARHPANISTCPWCGVGTNPQASVCRACGNDVR